MSGDDDLIRQRDDKELFKQAIKEASKEWLDEQFSSFGKWTAIGIGSVLFYLAFKLVGGTSAADAFIHR
jgi:hypothetical protein